MGEPLIHIRHRHRASKYTYFSSFLANPGFIPCLINGVSLKRRAALIATGVEAH